MTRFESRADTEMGLSDEGIRQRVALAGLIGTATPVVVLLAGRRTFLIATREPTVQGGAMHGAVESGALADLGGPSHERRQAL